MYCKSCGCTLPEGDKFCPACGAKVETTPEMPEMPKIPVIDSVPEAGPSETPPPPPVSPPPQQSGSYTPPPNPYTPNPYQAPKPTYPSAPSYGPVPPPNPPPYGQPYSYPNSPYGGRGNYQTQDDTSPLSLGSYLLYLFLFSIPFVGFVLELVYAFSQGNVNRKNLARAYLLFQLIAFVLSFLLFFLIGMFLTPYMEDFVNSMSYYS